MILQDFWKEIDEADEQLALCNVILAFKNG